MGKKEKRWMNKCRERERKCLVAVSLLVCRSLQLAGKTTLPLSVSPTSPSIYLSLPLCLGIQQWHETSVTTR